jgi:Flp pilus assembly protein TadG
MEGVVSPEGAARKRTLPGRGLLLRMRRFVEDRRGVGAIEFAIVAPLMIMTYIGAFEISVAVSLSRKVNRASSTVSDLLTRSKTTNTTTLASMKDVTRNIIAPFPQDYYTLKITGIAVDADGNATIAWSRGWTRAEGGGEDGEDSGEMEVEIFAGTKGDAVTLPKEMDAKNTFIVRTEFTVQYKILLMAPGLSSELRSLPLERTSFFRQREGDGITCSDC